MTLLQPKNQSIFILILCLFGVVFAFNLPEPEVQWRVLGVGNANYRIKVISQTLVASEYLKDGFFPYDNLIVYSSKGQCLLPGVTWDISVSDRAKEESVLDLFNFTVPLMLLSLLMLIFSLVNLIWRGWKKKAYLATVLGLCLSWVCIMRLLGPRASIDPDWSGFDLNCIYSVKITATLVSINQQATNSFIGLAMVILLIELVAILIFIRSFLYSSN